MAKMYMKFIGIDNFLKKFTDYSDQSKKKVALACKTCAYAVVQYSMQNVKDNKSVVSGQLLTSFRVEGSGYDYKAGTNTEYAPIVEHGYAKHTITAKNKKVLATTTGPGGGGNWIFFGKEVEVGPSKPKPFFNPAVEVARKEFQDDLKAAING